ncbi:hypothetical protein YC2023_121815 [Brassica napus]
MESLTERKKREKERESRRGEISVGYTMQQRDQETTVDCCIMVRSFADSEPHLSSAVGLTRVMTHNL